MHHKNPWDPATYGGAAKDSENLAINQMIIGAMRAGKPWHEMAAQELRDFLASGNSPMGTPIYSENAKNRVIPGPAGPLTLRIFAPAKVDGIYLHIHGGGWVIGRSDGQDILLENIATNCNLAVVSVEYRLAPEHPYPAGPDDCEAAAMWLVQNAKREFGSDKIFIGGESAGGHLSAVTILRMRDKHKYSGFAGANLVFGVFDLGMTPSAANWGDEPLIINTPVMRWFINHFGVTDKARSPEISPLYADLTGLPPALFTIGTQDPLRDDSLFMYARWIAGGNRAELAVYPGGAHGFTAFPTQMGAAARARCETFLKG
jgi:acetyl esterase/lipase